MLVGFIKAQLIAKNKWFLAYKISQFNMPKMYENSEIKSTILDLKLEKRNNGSSCSPVKRFCLRLRALLQVIREQSMEGKVKHPPGKTKALVLDKYVT